MVRSAMMGARVRRKEDPRLITGSSVYVDDMRLTGMVHAVFHRSPYAHANIKSIDTSAAKSAPGVLAVYTNSELREFCGVMLEGATEYFDPDPDDSIPTPEVQPMAQDRVRWAGEAIAVVLAESVAAGEDASELIMVEYEELPVVTDVEAAMAEDSPRIWEPVPNNIGLHKVHNQGDVDAAFQNADVTVSQRIRSQRVIPMAMEGRATIVAPDPLRQGFIGWTSTQAPHWWRNEIAKQLGISQAHFRVIAPEVGGGFGSKIGAYQEDLVVAALAKQYNRPVKWIEDRSQNIIGTHHGRAQVADIELAATSEGRITGLKLSVVQDVGGYPRGLDLVEFTHMMACGCYDIANVKTDIKAVYTNTMAVGAYRGAGRPEAAYYIERAVNILAHKLGKDPADIRKLNFIPPDQFPHTTGTGERYDTGEYARAVDKALEVSGYQQLRQEQEQARAEGRLFGIGMASYVEICGFGPFESNTVKVEPSGAVSVYTGISPHGQGQETTFAQIVADRLGADYDQVIIHHGDTDNTAQGHGTMGSRGLVVGGGALMLSIDKIKEKVTRIAANMLEVSPDDIELVDGRYQVAGAPDRSKTFAELADAAYNDIPDGMEYGLNTTDYFAPDDETFPFGTHIVACEVDADTGKVKLLKYFSIDDCGTVISPLLIAGQVHGGLAQGIAQALTEEAVYDESGQLVTATLMDYAMPKAELFPEFTLDRTVTTSPLNPLGAKGIGEAATIGSTPAVANAVMDALSPLGITHIDLPLTAPKVWAAIQGVNS